MTNLGVLLRGLGWDGCRCGIAENLVKFSEDLGGFDGGSSRVRSGKSWKEAIGLVGSHNFRYVGWRKRVISVNGFR